MTEFGVGAVVNSGKMDICVVKAPSGIWMGRGGAYQESTVQSWIENKDFEFDVKSFGIKL